MMMARIAEVDLLEFESDCNLKLLEATEAKFADERQQLLQQTCLTTQSRTAKMLDPLLLIPLLVLLTVRWIDGLKQNLGHSVHPQLSLHSRYASSYKESVSGKSLWEWTSNSITKTLVPSLSTSPNSCHKQVVCAIWSDSTVQSSSPLPHLSLRLPLSYPSHQEGKENLLYQSSQSAISSEPHIGFLGGG